MALIVVRIVGRAHSTLEELSIVILVRIGTKVTIAIVLAEGWLTHAAGDVTNCYENLNFSK